MIHDSIKNLDRYAGLFKDFDKIKKAAENPFDLEMGKNELSGDELYVSRSNFETVVENVGFEMHKVYADIQCVIRGREKMRYCLASQNGGNYNSERDVLNLSDVEGDVVDVVVNEGEFCLFFPEEYHSPCGAVEGVPETVDKLVFKIKSK